MRAAEALAPLAEAERALTLYEGLRAGHMRAFVRVATDLDPVLRDLAVAVTRREDLSGPLVRHAWEIALGGLDLFAWRCSLRAWLAGVLVGVAGPASAPDPRPPVPPGVPPPARTAPALAAAGTDDWTDLPWGRRWSALCWDTLQQGWDALPALQRQVLVLADVHSWDERDTADALGLTRSRYAEEAGAARLAMHDALAALAGADGTRGGAGCGHKPAEAFGRPDPDARCPGCAVIARRWARVSGLLPPAAVPRATALDPELVAVFRRWRAARLRGLRGLLVRLGG